jgi:hypothetical protein
MNVWAVEIWNNITGNDLTYYDVWETEDLAFRAACIEAKEVMDPQSCSFPRKPMSKNQYDQFLNLFNQNKYADALSFYSDWNNSLTNIEERYDFNVYRAPVRGNEDSHSRGYIG